jgi:aminoglycoside/choline kinase family phosphotransferase
VEVDALAEYLASFSHYFTHRDFHSRNIMVKDEQLALIDFQDARLGASSYDLVSLVFDNYVGFNLTTRTELLAQGLASLELVLTREETHALHASYPAMILQRQLKAIGTYGFLTLNKKRGNYLRYVAPAVESLGLDIIPDKRWSFLSTELPAILRESPVHDR